MSVAYPVGSPLVPHIKVHVVPPLVLREIPFKAATRTTWSLRSFSNSCRQDSKNRTTESAIWCQVIPCCAAINREKKTLLINVKVSKSTQSCSPPKPVFPVSSSGLTAIDPVDKLGRLSVNGTHTGFGSAKLLVRHTPPLTAPAYAMLLFVG